ncbi:MAG: hypothetical protein RLZZ184_3327 [Cyanobacteriota bacterium]|jgi:hypothetical protein
MFKFYYCGGLEAHPTRVLSLPHKSLKNFSYANYLYFSSSVKMGKFSLFQVAKSAKDLSR